MKDIVKLFIVAFQSLVLIALFSAPAAGKDATIELEFQENVFSAHIKNATLPAVVEKIKTEMDVWVKGKRRLPSKKYSVEFENLPLSEGLKRILSTTNHCLFFDENGDLEGIFILNGPGGSHKKVRRKSYTSRRHTSSSAWREQARRNAARRRRR